MHQLVQEGGVLDENSLYCYLLLCRDFAETCLLAFRGDSLVAFVTAYRPPRRPECLFAWQIGVAASARRRGLAGRLLENLLEQPGCAGVRFIEATITPSNAASRKLFASLAMTLNAPCHVLPGFAGELFGTSEHEEEELFRIGPLK